MPISKSAKKSLRASRAKRARNLVKVNQLKKALKKVDKTNVNQTISLIDKSAKSHLISKNKAGRLKSHLGKKFGTSKKEVKATVKKKSTKK